MSAEFSLRQVLACLNVSVFDPLVEPALKKACRLDAEQKAAKRNPFHSVFSLIVLQLSALLCFYGLKAYALTAGLFLVVFCGIVLRKTTSQAGRFFVKIYFLTGLLLLADRLFSLSPLLVVGLVFCCLLYSMFTPRARDDRALSAVWLFCAVAGSVFLFAPDLFPWFVSLFSVIGILGLLFPLKNVYSREPAIVFSVFPLFLLLGCEIVSLIDGTTVCVKNDALIAFSVAAEFLLLVFCLRKDLEPGETVLFLSADVALFLTGLFLSNGLGGTIVLFSIAFFTDARMLGRTAVILFSAFLIVFFLSLPISLLTAGWVSCVSGMVFGFCYLRLKRFSSQEKY